MWYLRYSIQRTLWKSWNVFQTYITSYRFRSKYYWKLVDNGAVPTIQFSIAKRVKGNTFINNCNLCLSEKAFIVRNLDDVNMLKKRSEFISKCRHTNKRLLNRVKDDSNGWLWCVFVFTTCFFITYKIFLFL